MTWTDFLKSFLRQSTYALAFFAAAALLAEYLTPGSITPFVDPLPVAVFALSLLSADAMRRQVTPKVWMRAVAGFVLIVAVVILVSGMSRGTDKTDVGALIVVGGALFFVSWQMLGST